MAIKFKWDMFVTSFLPLWVSVLLISLWNIATQTKQAWGENNSICINLKISFLNNLIAISFVTIIIILVLASMISINNFLRDKIATKTKQKAKIVEAKKANKLTSEFLLAYILPMIAFDFRNAQNIVLFIIYFFTLAFLCIRNSNIYTNIFLELKGYKIFECDVQCHVADECKIYNNSIVISSQDITSQLEQEFDFWDFDNYIYIDIREDEANE